jgi:hypothetical protein
MHIAATTAEEYLAALPPERRAVIAAVRAMVLAYLPAGFEESVNWGMLVYQVPRSRVPVTYNGHPLTAVGLAAQKRHYALYLMSVYGDAQAEAALREGFRAAGKKLDMGKSCVRFGRVEDVPLEVLGRAVGWMSMEAFIEREERVHPVGNGGKAVKGTVGGGGGGAGAKAVEKGVPGAKRAAVAKTAGTPARTAPAAKRTASGKTGAASARPANAKAGAASTSSTVKKGPRTKSATSAGARARRPR